MIAQDTTRYGEDIYGKLMLPELLCRLCKIEGAHWIRLLYCYPNRITDELIDVIATEDKILKYIDLPLQHSVGRVLSEMNRGEDTESLTALIQKMRDRIPNMVIPLPLLQDFRERRKKNLTKWRSSPVISVLTVWDVLPIRRKKTRLPR